jgi:MFS family permease
MLCVGRNIGVFVTARIIQGLSSGLVWSVGLALLVDTVGSSQIGQAMGYVGIGINLGVLLSPLLGRVVFNRAGYYPVFAMLFALIALDTILRLAIVKGKQSIRGVDPRDAGNQTSPRNDARDSQYTSEDNHEGESRQNSPTSKRKLPRRLHATCFAALYCGNWCQSDTVCAHFIVRHCSASLRE